MTSDTFWQLIDSSRRASDGSFEGRCEALREALTALEPAQVNAFDRVYATCMNRAYTWDLWAAAYVIGGGCSDDAFRDFRSWLISMGQVQFDAALADPDSLATVKLGVDGEEDAFFEEFAYVARSVYEEMTDDDLPGPFGPHPDDPSGEPWDEDDLPERMPRLSAIYDN